MGYLFSAIAGAFTYWLISLPGRSVKLQIPIMSDSDFEPTLASAAVDSCECAHSLLKEVILYIISRSSPNRLTKDKLEAYLIIASQTVPLGFEVTQGGNGVHIVGMGRYIRRLSEMGLISIKRLENQSGKHRFSYRIRGEAKQTLIPPKVRECVDFLISEWDGKSSKGLVELLNYRMGGFGADNR